MDVRSRRRWLKVTAIAGAVMFVIGLVALPLTDPVGTGAFDGVPRGWAVAFVSMGLLFGLSGFLTLKAPAPEPLARARRRWLALAALGLINLVLQVFPGREANWLSLASAGGLVLFSLVTYALEWWQVRRRRAAEKTVGVGPSPELEVS